jgi:hypothetical protein
MKIYELTKTAEAEAYKPQLERFFYDKIYIVENLSDYDNLPIEVKNWRIAVADCG